MKKLIQLLILLVCVTGCATKTGFNRSAIDQAFMGKSKEITEEEIKKALDLKPQLRFPFKVAVALTVKTMRPVYDHQYSMVESDDWRWSVEDKARVTALTEKLKSSGVVSDVFVISDLARDGSDLKSLRLAAAKHGADVILQVEGVAQVDRWYNPLSILNLVILPAYVIPTTHSDVLFVIKGALWDVGNEFLYLAVESESEQTEFGPTLLLKDKETIQKAKEAALKDFDEEFVKRVIALKKED